MSDWSDTPPTVAGDYWVRRIPSGEEQTGALDGENWYFKWPYEDWFPADNPEQFQFGQRIPTNAELGELLGLIEEYGLRCKAYGLAIQSLGSDEQFGLRMMRDEMLAKINAILGVRNDAGAS